MKKQSQGFTLIELLVAILLAALIIMTLMRQQGQLSMTNSDANLQITQAAIAEAIGYKYASDLSQPGYSVTGDAGEDFSEIRNELSDSQKEMLNLLSYSAENIDGAVKVQVWIRDNPTDPRQLTLEIP